MDEKYDELIFEASLCERIENYDDMVRVMKEAIKLMKSQKFDNHVKSRNLFSVAYKNLAGSRRASWRTLSAEHAKNEGKNERYVTVVRKYMRVVEEELHKTCNDLLSTIDEYILDSPSFADTEIKVFFLKMKGDYLRYKAEVCEDDREEAKRVGDMSHNDYNAARSVAKDLKCTNPVKLGLALNYSVYLYEIAKDCKKACEVAKDAFDEAIAGLEELSEDHYKDSTLIMQLLRDNMTLWTNQEENLKEEEEQYQEDIDREHGEATGGF